MKNLDTKRLLEDLLFDETQALEPPWPGKKKVKIYLEFETFRDDDGQLEAIETNCAHVQWRSRCDHSGLTVFTENGSRHFSWTDLPKKLILEMDQGYSAVYLHPNDVIPFPIAKRGPWSEFECPGWFGMGLYNGLLKAGCQQVV